jgi:hypothetical protein
MSDRLRAAKRRRTGPPQIGAPSEADKAITPANLPSSSAYSTRTVKSSPVLPLIAICARVFVANFPKFSKDPRQWEPRKAWRAVSVQLKSLPDSTIQTLFAMLSSSCPHLLSHDLVKEVRIVVSSECVYVGTSQIRFKKGLFARSFHHPDEWYGRRTLANQ